MQPCLHHHRIALLLPPVGDESLDRRRFLSLLIMNGAVVRRECRYPRPGNADIVGPNGWPCFNGGVVSLDHNLGGTGTLVQCLVSYHPANRVFFVGLQRFKQWSKGQKMEAFNRAKSQCAEEMKKDITVGKKIDTSLLAKCLYDHFPIAKSPQAPGGKLRAVAVFPGYFQDDHTGAPEKFGLVTIDGYLIDDTIELPIIDLNADALYLRVIAVLPR